MRTLAMAIVVVVAAPLSAQPPVDSWPSPLILTVQADPAPASPIPQEPAVLQANPDDAAARLAALTEPPRTLNGQQHWIAVNFGVGQPSAARLGVKVLARENNSLWLEVYGGSALFNGMYGFGARIQHTALTLGNGDNFFISPGLGTHILPNWYDDDGMMSGHRHHHDGYGACGRFTTLYYLAADVDFSWLHDFTPRFGFELGAKLGVAGRLAGAVGDDYPSGTMWGRNFYPIATLYGGFRF